MAEPAREDVGRVAMPERVGPYRILQFLGGGGMGEVYLAQSDQLQQRVALKVIKPGMDTREVLARFELERQALARMDHHNIARVLDAGMTGQGRPFFTMEYVPGLPLSRYCDERRLSVRERIGLFLEVCDAVQHAHQKGVIHRDLTPRNILVKEENDKPVPKVIDFGLARAVQPAGLARSLFTEHGQLVGTIGYVSPEQAQASPVDVDTRTDVYSLGAILYELLVGELPLDPGELRAAGLLEIQRRIREEEPRPPSVRVRQKDPTSDLHAQERGTTTERLRRTVSRDLDWITLKALHKDRRRRYPTVQGLAEDLQRFLKDEPVQAGPPGSGYRLRKWAARHRFGVAVGAVLAVGAGSSAWWFVQAVQARAEAARERVLASDPALLQSLRDQQRNDLWPAREATVPQLEAWLGTAAELVGRMGEHETRLAQLDAEVAASGAAAPSRVVSQRDRQRGLLAQLRAFRDGDPEANRPPAMTVVRERMQRALAIRRATVDAHRATWAEAGDEIAGDPRFGGWRLGPQVGLVPLRKNEAGLWEFWVWESGERPEPDPASRSGWAVKGETGLVLVLLPGGGTQMGARAVEDVHAGDPRHRGFARPGKAELPLIPARLSPFLLSKFEMTQAQWERLTGRNPSNWRWETGDPLAEKDVRPCHPVEQVSWRDSQSQLRRWHLELPTEAQWEYACRSGTEGPWHVRQWQDLDEYANLADRAARHNPDDPAEWLDIVDELHDGYVYTAPVGSYLGNGFGIHDMHGNVGEWCADGWMKTLAGGVEDDGRCQLQGSRGTGRGMIRGGSFRSGPQRLRSSFRQQEMAVNEMMTVGVRPMWWPH